MVARTLDPGFMFLLGSKWRLDLPRMRLRLLVLLSLIFGIQLVHFAAAHTAHAQSGPPHGRSREVFDYALANLFDQPFPFSRAALADKNFELFPNSQKLLDDESSWTPHFMTVVSWRPASGERLSLAGTEARVGDIVVVRSGNDKLPMVYVGENQFSDWSEQPAVAKRSSFFIYPLTKLAGLELNTMPPRWHRSLLEEHNVCRVSRDNEFDDPGSVDVDDDGAGPQASGVLYATKSAHNGLFDPWHTSGNLSVNPRWLQRPRVRGSHFVSTRWWGPRVSYAVLRASGEKSDEDVILEAYEIIELTSVSSGDIQPYTLDEDGYVLRDRRIHAAHDQWEELLKKREGVLKDASSTKEEKDSVNSRAEKAKKVWQKVVELVHLEYAQAGVPWGRITGTGRLENDLITDVLFDGIISLGVGSVTRLSDAAIKGGTKALSAKFGRDAVIEVTSKETVEITTAAGARQIITSSVSNGPIIVTSRGVAVTAETLAKQGTSQLVGNFTGLAGKSVDDIVARVPASWKIVPQDRGMGIKFLDDAGFERVRLHGPSPSAPAGSNSASGWTLRVMDRAGNYYDDAGRVVPRSANSGHIPIQGNPQAR